MGAGVGSLTSFAASPTISTSLVNASRRISSSSSALRDVPWEYRSAFSPASRRWASRTTSSGGGIQQARTCGHGIPDVAAQVAGRAEIDFPAEQLGQLEFKTGQQEQTRDPSGLELDEEVDVAIWAQLATKRRAEEAQPANAVSLTERLEHRIVDGDTGCQLHPASVAVKARDRTSDKAKGPPHRLS